MKAIYRGELALCLLAAAGAPACQGKEPILAPSTQAAPPPAAATKAPQSAAVAAPAEPGVNVPAIKVDTVGYPTNWRKVAISNVDPNAASPVLEDEQGKAVFTISPDHISARGVDAASKDPVWQLDFTEFESPGRFRVRVGKARSDVFEIGGTGYAHALVAAQKFFYFQRTRTALTEPFAVWEGSKYLRAEPSHVHADVGWDLEDYPEKKRKWNVVGGWHDAGNYDMYVPSTAPTAQALLMAFEAHPEAFRDGDLNIPESGNKLPDILDEAKWGLSWVLSLQEPASGAFRTREAVMQWTPDLPADRDRSVRWIAGPSTSSTAKAVAALAVAARVYDKLDPAFAKQAAEAAKKGWAFLEAHPERIVVDGKGSPQPLWDDEPERNDTGARFVAAVEMWRTFHVPEALDTARAAMASAEAQPRLFVEGAWANLSRWALASLALDAQVPEELRNQAQQRILEAVLPFRERIENGDGYRCASELDDYYWGHNSNLLEKAHLLLVAYELTGERWLLDAARDQWHWILGRNPNGYGMVTRVGKGPDRIYHTEWGRMSPPPPGYLVGGPNAVQMKVLSPDAPAKALLWDNAFPLRSGLPPHSLWHSQQSDLWDGKFVKENVWENGWWSVTEPDIYYNANLVLVGAAMASAESERSAAPIPKSPSVAAKSRAPLPQTQRGPTQR